MNRDLAIYVMTHYSELMTSDERLANRHLTVLFKAADGKPTAETEATLRYEGGPRARWLSDAPTVLRLAEGGLDAFRARVAERILAEHPGEVFLNWCPQCGGLTRTPKAKLCLHCGYSWHHVAAV